MSAEIARQEPRPIVGFAVKLSTVDEAWRLSQALALSQMIPDKLRGKPSDVLAIVLYGQELGLGPMQSTQVIYIVEGRPSLSAQLWRALTRRAGHKFRLVERVHNKSCTVEIVRSDDPDAPHRETFTIDDAIQYGKVTIKDNKPYARAQSGKPLAWETGTDDMLFARATARGCRAACPEVALGFYDDDEMPTVEPSAPLVEVTADPHPDDIPDAEVIPDSDMAAEVAAIAAEATAAEDRTGWPPAEDMADADA